MATILVCHALIDGVSAGKHPLVTLFSHGSKQLRPPPQSGSTFVGISLVLEGLVWTPFNRLSSFWLQRWFYSWQLKKKYLKRTGDFQALSVSPSCLDSAPVLVKAILHPHPNYLPKVPFLTIHPVLLEALCPPPFANPWARKTLFTVSSSCSSDLQFRTAFQMLWGPQLGWGMLLPYLMRSTTKHCLSELGPIHPGAFHPLRLWQEVSPCSKYVMWQAGPFQTHSVVWMSMNLNQHPKIMSETC